jgi:hypothetical protein
MGRIVGAVLIGIVVLQASIRLFGGQIGASIEPAIVGVMGGVKGIMVANIPVINKSRGPRSDFFNLVVRESVLNVGSQWKFGGREHGDQSGNARSAAPLVYRGNSEREFENVGKHNRRPDIIGWRLPVIFADQSYRRFLSRRQVFNITRNNANVSPQLAPFSILHNGQLVVGGGPLPASPISGNGSSGQGTQNHQGYSDFERPIRVAFFLMNMVFMALGVWLAMFRSSRHIGWLPIGICLILIGWRVHSGCDPFCDSECGPRVRSRKPLPGGSGHRLGRHYDRPARCSLHWRRGGSSRLHPVIPGSAARS